jgi:hypothetical protein
MKIIQVKLLLSCLKIVFIGNPYLNEGVMVHGDAVYISATSTNVAIDTL